MRKGVLLPVVVIAALGGSLAIAAGARGDGPWVYIAELDVWVEQSDEQAVREAQPDPTITSGGSDLVAVAADEPRPPGYSASIQRVDNKSDTAVSSPFSGSGFIPTNVYTVSDGTVETTVWAGSYAASPSTGAIIKTMESWDTGVETNQQSEPEKQHGALTLTGFSGTSVSFVAADGWTGRYNISNRSIEMFEPKGLCPPSCPPAP